MKWNKNHLIFALLLIAVVGFSIMKVQDAAFIKSQYTTVSIRFKTEGVVEEDIRKALDKEKDKGGKFIPSITAWTQLEEAEVRNKNLNRSRKVPIQIVAGDMSLTAPMTLCYGNYLYQSDSKGCILDRDTAYHLYGTEDAVGNILSYDKQEYHIRGVVKSSRPLLIIGGEASMVYSNLELQYPKKQQEMGEVLAESFLSGNGFTQDYVMNDGYFYGSLIYSLLNLPLWLFYSILNIIILRYLWKMRSGIRPYKLSLYTIIAIICMIGYGAILYQFTGNLFFIPSKSMPTKFSDFDFWRELSLKTREHLQQLRYMVPNAKDVFLEEELSKLPLNLAVMVLLYLLLFIHARTWHKKED